MKQVCIQLEGEGDWSVIQEDRRREGLCWDEMLGLVARLILKGRDLTKSHWPDEIEKQPLTMSLTVTETWEGIVIEDTTGRFVGHLSDSEALGFLAVYTWTRGREHLFGGLISYEQWAKRWPKWQAPVAGLLTLQETAA